MVEAVIFDIDGTIDSIDLHIRAWKLTFQEFGKDVPSEAIRRQIGKGADELLPIFFSEDELRRFREELERYRSKLFKRECLPKVKAFPKVRELFERIKREGKQTALASTAKQDELDVYKEIARIDDSIDTVACSEEVKKSKPHPDICAAAVKKLGNIPPDQVIAVGDTPYDAEAASKINVRVIGLLCGGGNQEELRRAGCVAIYREPADMLGHYDSSPIGSVVRSAHVVEAN
jgi:HAD superfamily hydrolase (TIGR01549 family)